MRVFVYQPFISEFLADEAPCFALGMVEERKRKRGLLALRPNEVIPSEISDGGFNFGHALFGNVAFEVIHFIIII